MMNRSSSKWSNHPTQLSTVLGQVVVLYSDSGVVGLSGHTRIYCFFTRAQVWEEGNCVIRVGEEVMMDARLAPEQQRNEIVPYLATVVWREGSNIPPALSLRLLSPHTQEEMSHYQQAVPGLVVLLPDIMEDKLETSQVMRGIVACQGVRQKEEEVVAVNRAAKLKAEDLNQEGEPRNRKKRQRCSTDEEEPVKHLDCLHKINDMIAELERKVASDPPKVSQQPKASSQPEVIAYPQPGVAYSIQRPPSPTSIGFPNLNKRTTAPAWLGLTVAPGSVPTSINPSNNLLVPSKDTPFSIKEESDEEEKSPLKKSLFSNIFEHEERAMSPENDKNLLPKLPIKSDTRGGAKLSNLLQDKILTKTREKESGRQGGRKVNEDNRREKTTSQSRSRSREKTGNKKNKRRNESLIERRKTSRSRSKSRLKKSKKRSRSKSKSWLSEKVGHGKKKSRSNSSESRAPRSKHSKQERSKRFERKRSRRKREKSKSRSRSKRKLKSESRSRSRSCLKEIGKASKNKRSISPSPKRMKHAEKKRKRSHSRLKDRKSNKKKKLRKSRSSSPRENKREDLRTFIEKLKSNDVEKETCSINRDNTKSDCESEVSDDELIIKKRRLNRLKFLSKFKDAQKEEEKDDANVINLNKNAYEGIPIAFFEQPVDVFEDEDNNIQPVVFFDAEILNVGSSTFILQFGASATSMNKSYTFFKYLQADILQGSRLEKLLADSKIEVMDSLRLKTSKFDVAHSGKLNLYFKHPEMGSIKAEQEKDALIGFINFLESVKEGKSVILVTHRKDTVLPALFSLLSKHELLTKFSNLVSHCCELVHLAWELHMDHLWQGARYPGLRSVAEFVDKDLQWDDGYIPCDKISLLLEKLVNKLMEDQKYKKVDRFVEQCGGVGVMDYMTAKYNLVQDAGGDNNLGGMETPEYVEVVRGSDQWGRKVRIDLKWKKEAGQIEERSNRRTPLPEPDSLLNDGEHHVKILKPSESKSISVKRVISWSDKSFNTFLPPGVSKVSSLSSTSILLRVPALKPRISELLGVSVLIQQNPEFTQCKILTSTEVLMQPKNSMFPIVEATLENISKEDVILDSRIINFAVANIKIDSKYEI